MTKISRPLLFLTACVNPSGMAFTALQDGEERKRQYMEAIDFYLKECNWRILVVENTGFDFSPLYAKEVEEGRLECLAFDGNSFDKSLGKGYGEGLILNYAFTHSEFLKEADSVIKVTGRHKVKNVKKMLSVSSLFIHKCKDFVVCDVNTVTHGALSDAFLASPSFFADFLNVEVAKCDDSKGVWFEHALYQSIKKCISGDTQFICLPILPLQQGVSGSTGKNFQKPSLKEKTKQFLKTLAFQANIKRIK